MSYVVDMELCRLSGSSSLILPLLLPHLLLLIELLSFIAADTDADADTVAADQSTAVAAAARVKRINLLNYVVGLLISSLCRPQ